MGYPLLNLTRHRKDVDWYMRKLEDVVITTLAEFGIAGIRVPGKTGVWLDEHSKIAFSGVRISRWCTYHGFSLNILPCSHRFRIMNPCGLGDIRIAAMADKASPAPLFHSVSMSIQHQFCHVFEYASMVTVEEL
jgi:lipoyl(octanoyl) transferase